MAYSLVQTVEVGAGGASSITFSSIPATGKDLVLSFSARSTHAATVADNVLISLNSSTSNFSGLYLFGNGSSVFTGTDTREVGGYVGDSATASTFSNVQVYFADYTSSANKSFSVDSVTENNSTQNSIYIDAKLWSNTAAITSITLTPTSGNFTQFTTASLYIIDADNATGATPVIASPKATGGTITLEGGFFYHRFTTAGTFVPNQNVTCDYVIVGGGGAAGAVSSSIVGGGGGGGAVYSSINYSGLTQQTAFSAVANTNYAVTIGAGGVSPDPGAGGNGGDSSVFGFTAIGGGGGGYSGAGAAGGSGGGSSSNGGGGGAGTSGQGRNGGNGGSFAGGGGGGATAVGGNISGSTSGGGGAGVNLNIAGVGFVAAGGYGGTSRDGGSFGSNPTGSGSESFGGGGRGERSRTGGSGPGGNGGPGLVIIRYSA